MVIRKPFPAEHPYSSHISRFALFPSCNVPSDTCQYPETRVPDVIALQKTKGFDARVERISRTAKALSWPADGSYDHLPKGTRGSRTQRQVYPIPPKLFLPNDDAGGGKRNVSMATDEAIRDENRKRWTTTYQSNNSNVEIKELRPPSNAIRTKETEQKEHIMATSTNYYCPRKMTLTEREEHRLLNGKTYANLPENEETSRLNPCYNNPLPKLHQFSGIEQCGKCPDAPLIKDRPPPENYYRLLMQQQHETVQQIEAQNRWRVYEAQTPSHDVGALRRKMDVSSVKHQPDVFYDHEGRYQRERSGIYRTSYNPALLEYVMNKEQRNGATLTDTSDCHKNALDLPVDLNGQMADIIRYNRSLCGSVGQLNHQPSPHEVLGSFGAAKDLQRIHLQPDGSMSDIRTQEGDVLWKYSTYGGDYNIPRYLQDHPPIPIHARTEPREILSRCNQAISNLPLACPNVCPVYDGACMRPKTAPAGMFGDETDDPSALTISEARVLNSASYQERQRKLKRALAAECVSFKGSEPTFGQCLPDGGQHYDLTHWINTRLQGKYSCPSTKTTIHHRFDKCFPDRAPDLRAHNCQGKKHDFQCGINSQVLRGTAQQKPLGINNKPLIIQTS